MGSRTLDSLIRGHVVLSVTSGMNICPMRVSRSEPRIDPVLAGGENATRIERCLDSVGRTGDGEASCWMPSQDAVLLLLFWSDALWSDPTPSAWLAGHASGEEAA
jgi:hypothetical protein